MEIGLEEWGLLSEHYMKTYPVDHINVGLPKKCVELIRYGRVPSDKQLKAAIEIRKKAYQDGFDFVS